MKYNAKVIYQQEDFIAINKAWLHKNGQVRILQLVSKVIFNIIGGSLIFMGVIGIFHLIRSLIIGNGITPVVSIFLSIVFIVIGFLLILRSDSKRLGKIMWKRYKEKGYEIIYSFYSDYFAVQTPISEHRLSYSIIKSLCEDDKRYYLFVTSNEAHIINKVGLGLHDSKQFGRFIAKKTGLGIVEIKP